MLAYKPQTANAMSKSPVLKSHHWDKQTHSSAVEIQVHLQECMDKMKEEIKREKEDKKYVSLK